MNSSWGYSDCSDRYFRGSDDDIDVVPLMNEFSTDMTVPAHLLVNTQFILYKLCICGDFEERSTHIVE